MHQEVAVDVSVRMDKQTGLTDAMDVCEVNQKQAPQSDENGTTTLEKRCHAEGQNREST